MTKPEFSPLKTIKDFFFADCTAKEAAAEIRQLSKEAQSQLATGIADGSFTY